MSTGPVIVTAVVVPTNPAAPSVRRAAEPIRRAAVHRRLAREPDPAPNSPANQPVTLAAAESHQWLWLSAARDRIAQTTYEARQRATSTRANELRHDLAPSLPAPAPTVGSRAPGASCT